MNDFRRTILWLVLIAAAFLLFNNWNRSKAPAPIATQQSAAPGVSSTLPAEEVLLVADEVATAVGADKSPADQANTFEVVTDVLRLRFTEADASINRAELLKHKSAEDPELNVVLFDETASRSYKEQSGVYGANFAAMSSNMQLVTDLSSLQPQQTDWVVQFRSDVVAGLQLEKTFRIKAGSYEIAVEHKLTNLGQDTVTPRLFYQLVRDNTIIKNSKLYSTFTGFAAYSDADKFKKISFDSIQDRSVKIPEPSNDGWVAMIQHYFTSAWLLPDDVPRQFFTQKYANNLYAVGMIETLPALAAGQSETAQAMLYVGPQIESYFNTLAPGFSAVKDYGMFTFLSRPTYWIIVNVHKFINNWGWSIVAFVLLLKIVFFWLNAKAYSSMAKMKALQPRINKIREINKENPQKMQQEMMRIYREEKVNPIGGCLPILLQIPFFIALYWVLLSSVEFRGAPWILWIQDLSKPDPFYILPLLMAATTLFQTWLNPTPADPMQAKIMWMMPVMFSVMFMFFPSGLVLYWFVNNLLAIAQQWVINKRLGIVRPPRNS